MMTHEQIAKIRAEQGPAAAIAAQDSEKKAKDEEKRQKARRENRNFTQVNPKGWMVLQRLMKQDANAARVYAFFAEHMGPDGTLCASRSTIAEALGVTERTVSRHVKTLEEMKSLIVLKLGTANVYCLNPAEVWKSFDNAKPYAAFNTKALVGKTENPFVKKRLAVLMDGKLPEPKTLLDVMEEGDETEGGIDFNDFTDPAE
jgi:DNA-binding MarR family transcriptional regulator